MTTTTADQITFERWRITGRWEQFAPGQLAAEVHSGPLAGRKAYDPPADWTELPPCETCEGTGAITELVGLPPNGIVMDCPVCLGSGKQRLAVQVPCNYGECGYWHPLIPTPRRPEPEQSCQFCNATGLVTVAWATVEWGPLEVVGFGILGIDRDGDYVRLSDGTKLDPPPGVNPADLIGQWGRGGNLVVA